MMAQLKDVETKQKRALQVPLTSQGLNGHGRAQNPGPSSGNQPLGWGVLVAAGNMASGMSSKGWAKWGGGAPDTPLCHPPIFHQCFHDLSHQEAGGKGPWAVWLPSLLPFSLHYKWVTRSSPNSRGGAYIGKWIPGGRHHGTPPRGCLPHPE